MASTSPDHSRPLASRLAAGWVWWGLLAACFALGAFGLFWALRAGDDGRGLNRGPADEAAPSSHPSRDIDRSRSH
jgi:hypothetical protein